MAPALRLLSLGKSDFPLLLRLLGFLEVNSFVGLDGGGVRGLSSLITLEHLMRTINPDNPPKPCEYFDLIGGTSTGGRVYLQVRWDTIKLTSGLG